MKTNRMARIFSVMKASSQKASSQFSLVSSQENLLGLFPRTENSTSVLEFCGWNRCGLKRVFLRKRVARDGRALRSFDHPDPHRGRVGGRDACRPQHGVLSEDFVVNLRDQIILAVGIAAPYLTELDGIHCHGVVPDS